MRRRARSIATVTAMSLGACFAERERLDTPVVQILLTAREVAAGDTIRGTLEARDASGIMDWVIMARSAFDTVRVYGDAPELSEISADFRLPLVDTIPAGTRVVVEAVVQDDQDFAVAHADTVTVIP
ncbi:MAG TPA: hypothetical protein VFB46_00345 [Gemmatimonadaceae bacterium]|nr:hypothetical protein [Gemmatimonadaceae bacterium]